MSNPNPPKPLQQKPPLGKNSLPQAVIHFKGQVKPENCPSFVQMVTSLNHTLLEPPKHSHIHVVSVKWTAASNLVVHAQAPSPSALVLALKATQASYESDHLIIKDITPNMTWSHMTLSHIFTGKNSKTSAYSPEDLHEELSTHNPNYASLTIRQLPSWVRNPKNFKDRQLSSISFAFEDPDGNHLRQLIGTPLTTFGNLRCTLKAWAPPKKSPQKGKPPSAADN